jgi:hypothetical protein
MIAPLSFLLTLGREKGQEAAASRAKRRCAATAARSAGHSSRVSYAGDWVTTVC